MISKRWLASWVDWSLACGDTSHIPIYVCTPYIVLPTCMHGRIPAVSSLGSASVWCFRSMVSDGWTSQHSLTVASSTWAQWRAITGFRFIPISISIFLDVSIFFSGQTNIAPPLVHPIGFLPNLLDGSVFTPLKSIWFAAASQTVALGMRFHGTRSFKGGYLFYAAIGLVLLLGSIPSKLVHKPVHESILWTALDVQP